MITNERQHLHTRKKLADLESLAAATRRGDAGGDPDRADPVLTLEEIKIMHAFGRAVVVLDDLEAGGGDNHAPCPLLLRAVCSVRHQRALPCRKHFRTKSGEEILDFRGTRPLKSREAPSVETMGLPT